MSIKGIFRTKSINEEVGKPDIIVLMFSDNLGVSVFGGALAAGAELTFGKIAPFLTEEWEELSQEQYQDIMRTEGLTN